MLLDTIREAITRITDYRELADLQAQLEMAFWARWMFWTTTASILIGTAIAFFGWRISRHSAFGAKPVSVVAMRTITWDRETANEMSCDIEIWNMQKYPIVIRSCVFTAVGLQFEQLPPIHNQGDEKWHPVENTLVRYADTPTVIAPDGQATVKPTGRFKWDRSEKFDIRVKWTISYFDPKRSRERKLHGQDRFDFTYLHRFG